MPIDRLGEHATRQQPERAARHRDEGVDADGLRLLLWLGEHGDDHPEDHRRRQRAANPLDEARSDQQALTLGERTKQRRGGEHTESNEKDAPLPDQVADATGQQKQATERDQIRVDHPRKVVLRETQVALDRRQGDVHDGRVEDDHQHAHTEHVEGHPPPPILRRHCAHRSRAPSARVEKPAA
jgi:hypothetical protein